MKKIILLLLLAMELLSLQGQTHFQNHQKYWFYRWRLRNHFMKVGPNQGESLIANQRGIGSNKHRLEWGDQTINLGYYLTILSTEYHQLASNNHSVNQTLKELYYALYALNRLDLNEESLFRSNFNGEPNPVAGDLNGYFGRDDVDTEFYDQNFDHFNNDKIPSQAQLATGAMSSDWDTDANAGYQALITDGGRSEMSQDQVYTIMMGLAMVQKFIPEAITYQSLVFQDGENSLHKEAENILMRIIGHCNGTSISESLWYAWRIKNPVTQNNTPRGHNMGTWSYGVGEATCKMKSNSSINFGFPPVSCDYPLSPDFTPYAHNNFSRWNAVSFNPQVTTGAPYATTADNSHMFGLICAMAGVSNTVPAHAAGYAARDLQHIPLVRQTLHGGSNPISDDFYQDLLNVAPCEGPYMFKWDPGSPDHNSAHFEWSTTDRLLHPARRGTNHYWPSEAPGLDYMVYHNLYYTVRPEYYGSPYDMIDNMIEVDFPIAVPFGSEIGTEDIPFTAKFFNTITATNTIYAEGSDPVQDGHSDVTYRAGSSISLEPGFLAESGSEFLAYIDPFECSSGGYYKNAKPNEDDEDFLSNGFQPHNRRQRVVSYSFNFDETDPEVFNLELDSAKLDSIQPDSIQRERLKGNTQEGNQKIMVYPNPSQGMFTIETKGIAEESLNVFITDVYGKVVSVKQNIPSGSIKIDLSSESSGLYFIRLVTKDEEWIRKVVLQ